MGTWTGRWPVLDGELILASQLEDEERTRARNPDEQLPPSDVTREWWGHAGNGDAGHAQIVEVARELSIPDHLVEDDPRGALAAIEQAIRDGRLVALRHRRHVRPNGGPVTPKTSEPEPPRNKKKSLSSAERREPHIEIFPGEEYRKGIPIGRLIVFDGSNVLAAYPAVGGPEKADTDGGGHSMSPTYAGQYVLRGPVRYVTNTWAESTIPWGAELKEEDGEVWSRADPGSPWIRQTGKDGAYTKAHTRERVREREVNLPPTPPELVMYANEAKRKFYLDEWTQTQLKPHWDLNDFGPAGFKLVTSAGRFRGELIHTTPLNEIGGSSELVQSHGCVHILPKDRDDMMSHDWLKDGVDVVVHTYGEKGP